MTENYFSPFKERPIDSNKEQEALQCTTQKKQKRTNEEQMNSSKYNKNLLSAVIHKLSEECMFTRHLSFEACRDPSL